MGRKKRKNVDVDDDAETGADETEKQTAKKEDEPSENKPLASKYGLTAHSGEIISEGRTIH